MELSTNIPTPRAKPAKDITLIVIPVKYIIAMANIILIGMDTAIISVGFKSLRNINNMTMASIPP